MTRRRSPVRRRPIRRRGLLPLGVLAAAAVLGGLVGAAPALRDSLGSNLGDGTATAYGEPIRGCRVTDGDTIRCGNERIRLLGIDAPEKPGGCRPGRHCAPGDYRRSTDSLDAALVGPLTIDRVGQDHYGRTIARVAGARGDLSCWQLKQGRAVYKGKWDDGLRVGRTCPGAIL